MILVRIRMLFCSTTVIGVFLATSFPLYQSNIVHLTVLPHGLCEYSNAPLLWILPLIYNNGFSFSGNVFLWSNGIYLT